MNPKCSNSYILAALCPDTVPWHVSHVYTAARAGLSPPTGPLC